MSAAFFFVKQKTAYDLRISDWSSDVCSSDLPHVSTGDLRRAGVKAGSPLGRQAKEVMARGELVSDEILLGMLEDRFSRDDTKGGFILDGYPRNLAQADALDALLGRIGQPMDYAVQLEVPVDLLVERIAGRAKAEGRADDSP